MRNSYVALLAVAAVLTAAHPAPAGGLAQGQTTKVAVATVKPLGTSTVKGVVLFTPFDHGVEINAEITGLAPGQHGFHIHEFGDCSAPDGSSAGPHFNPEHKPHGAPGADASHAGDYGNLQADGDGRATLKLVSHRITLDQSATGVLGRSVIIHEKADDLTSQPTGNAGGRIGCGVIVIQGDGTVPITEH
jgi:superoxide dismutase, Cu-Zn family